MSRISAKSNPPARAAETPPEGDFFALADCAPVLMWLAEPNGAWEYVNKGWVDFTGRTLDEEQGHGWTAGVHADDRQRVEDAFRRALDEQGRFEIEYRVARHDREYRWLLVAAAPRFDADERFVGYIGVCVDITDRKRSQTELQDLLAASDFAHAELAEQTRRLHRLAESDPLTGLLNRRSFREQIEVEWSRAQRHRRPLAAIMLDLDFFKKINDTHGHAAGDAVLQSVARLLVARCRPTDVVCRYGGEEFCMMAPETDETGAVTLAERLRAELHAMEVYVNGVALRVSASFGAADAREAGGIDDLIERADQALYLAKHTGRNRVVRFTSESALAEIRASDDPANILSRYTAAELMSAAPLIADDETVARAIAKLLEHEAAVAPVVDGEGRLVGTVSETDLIALDVSPQSWSRRVRDVIKTSVVCYDEHAPGQQVFQFLCRVPGHRVVVVRNGRPLGIISPHGLLRFFRQHVGGEAKRDGAAS